MPSQMHAQLSYLIPAPDDGALHLLRETPANEQALARLERCGPEALASAELLQLVLDSKADPLLPLRLLTQWATLNELAHSCPAEMLRVEGMSRIRLARLRAALEIGRRMWTEPLQDRPLIKSPSDAANILIPEMAGLEQEEMHALAVNTKNRVIGTSLVYRGSLHTTVIRVGELFRDAVRLNAAAVVIAHNHPSSDPSPSPEDLACNRELVQAGKLLDCDVLDHLIIGHGGEHNWISMKERGLGF